jgi:hypothetical protein
VLRKKITDVEKRNKRIRKIKGRTDHLKPFNLCRDYSERRLDNMEKDIKRDVKEHIISINKQIAQKQAELEAVKMKTP